MYNYYNDYFGIAQEVISLQFYKTGLPKHDAVYSLKEVMEEIDYSCLLNRYSKKGRKGYNPIMLFAVLLYANMRGVRAVDRIVELCQRDLGFIWLTQGKRPKRDAFYGFMNEKLLPEILESLHYQFIKKMVDKGYVTLEALYIDGTKIEANANRYTFVWRGSVNYHLAGLMTTISDLYVQYNTLIETNGYDRKYKLATEDMFVIEGVNKVNEIIEKNRANKKNNKKKISNNVIIEIDNISPLKMLQLQAKLKKISDGEQIVFLSGKGQKKSELQKLYEAFNDCGNKLLKYKNNFEIMGSSRNSYSKTDVASTFMRMKDDHMKNGQLKPAYNVQAAVENYFVIHGYVSSDRTDYNSLIPIIEKHKKIFGEVLKEVTADSGYCSERNLMYAEEANIEAFIKLQEHEKKKTRAYQNNIGKHYNMKRVVDSSGVHYICHENRKLHYIKNEKRTIDNYERIYTVYESRDCSGCSHKSECFNRYDEQKHENKNKQLRINERWEILKENAYESVLSDKGILNRQIRSIQTEGTFGDMKENDKFKRFNHRSEEKVYKEFLLYAFARNINKYHRFELGKIKKFEGKVTEIAA